MSKRSEFKRIHTEFLNSNIEQMSQFYRYKLNSRWFYRVLSDDIPRYQWFLHNLPDVNGLEVLDLCGSFGMFDAYLRFVNGYSFEYTSLDKDVTKLDFGSEYFKAFGLKPPRFIWADVNKPLPFPKNIFDMVWLIGWCDKAEKKNCDGLFKEVHRVLRPKGCFILNMAYKIMITRYSKEELSALLENAGFTIQRLELVPNKVDFGVVAHKSTDYHRI